MSLDTEETSTPPSTPDPPAPSELALEEAKTTFEYQVQRLREIDSKAIEILKANLLIIGVFVTALSIIGQTELDISAFVNLHTAVGGLLLLISTALAGVTYNASNLRGGVDLAAIEQSLDETKGSHFEPTLVRSYGEWIEHNADVTAVNDSLITITILLVTDAFVYVVIGIAIGVSGIPTAVSLLAFVILTGVLSIASWAAYHMDHIGSNGPPDGSTFAGVRLSKGASRERGHAAFWEMVRPATAESVSISDREGETETKIGSNADDDSIASADRPDR